jgi:hypothetical protein
MSPGEPGGAERGSVPAADPAAGAPSTAEWYRNFGTVDAPGNSACYAEWSVRIADDPELIGRIDAWPHNKRQPLLMLAAARFLGARTGPYPEFRAFLDAHWNEVARVVLSRSTQTNEAGRCATLLPSLAQIAAAGGRPLALLEVGASAGLALFPDRYGYAYDAGGEVTRLAPAGAVPGSFPVLGCAVTGPAPLPADLPPVVWRAGIDLNPLDVRSADDVAWLEALIWPEQDFRRERLRQAIAIAQSDPPLLVAGDLNDRLPALAAQAPPDATLVVFHSAVMAYVDAGARGRFRGTMARLAVERGCHWLSNEGPTVIIQADGSSVVPEMDERRLRGRFLLLHDGRPAAIAGPHGQSLEWL